MEKHKGGERGGRGRERRDGWLGKERGRERGGGGGVVIEGKARATLRLYSRNVPHLTRELAMQNGYWERLLRILEGGGDDRNV